MYLSLFIYLLGEASPNCVFFAKEVRTWYVHLCSEFSARTQCHFTLHSPHSLAMSSPAPSLTGLQQREVIITRTASAEMLQTFQLLHLEFYRGVLVDRQKPAKAAVAAPAQEAAAAARKKQTRTRIPSGSAEDLDAQAQASRLQCRLLSTLPSGRHLPRANGGCRKLRSSFEIPRAPSDPNTASFSRAPSVSARASASPMHVRYEPYPTARNDVDTPTSSDQKAAPSRHPRLCHSTSPVRTRRIRRETFQEP